MIWFRALAFSLFLLFPAFSRAAESEFAGRLPQPIDTAKIAAMKDFVSDALGKLGVPGAAFAIVEHGKVLYEGGVGVRALGSAQAIDARTLFMIGSNTKGLTTLLLSRLVDEGKLQWNERVTASYPAFRLGDAETTEKVRIRDLVCACTGLPRKDMNWIIGTQKSTSPDAIFAQLASSAPTTAFGEAFQYSNLMAAAAGYVGGAVAYPGKELGAAYDLAMKKMIFDPLGMIDTTFDMARVRGGNFASPHGTDPDGVPKLASLKPDLVIAPYRPAGGAWSSAHDMIRYVALELSKGVLPNGKRLVSEDNLLMRRQPNVVMAENVNYGMGLVVDKTSGVTLIRHGGGIAGYRSDIAILPEADVGAVILTNGGEGAYLLRPFMRRLMELLYDGEPKASADIEGAVSKIKQQRTKAREGLSVPATPELATRVTGNYVNDELGQLVARSDGGRLFFDFALYSSEMGSRISADGSISFVTIDPTVAGLEFTMSFQDDKPALSIKEGTFIYGFRRSAD